MVVHNNPSIVQRSQRILNTKSANNLSDNVEGPFAVIVISPVVTHVASRSSNGAIFTTPADKDYYLSFVNLNMSKVVGDSGSSIVITVIVSGVTVNLISILGITLTAERGELAQSFPIPIKIDRSTAITLTLAGTFTTARGSIGGYFEEVTAT